MHKNPTSNPFWLALFNFFAALAMSIMEMHSNVAAGVFAVLGLICLALAFKDWLNFPPRFRRRLEVIESLSFFREISLEEAAAIAYKEARLSGSIWAHAAEELGRDGRPESVQDYLAQYFVTKKLSIYGCREPSRAREPISQRDLKSGEFAGGAKTLRMPNGAVFSDLRIRRKDLKWIVEGFKNEGVFLRH